MRSAWLRSISRCIHAEPTAALLVVATDGRHNTLSPLQDTGKDPISGADASADDLIAVKNNQVGIEDTSAT